MGSSGSSEPSNENTNVDPLCDNNLINITTFKLETGGTVSIFGEAHLEYAKNAPLRRKSPSMYKNIIQKIMNLYPNGSQFNLYYEKFLVNDELKRMFKFSICLDQYLRTDSTVGFILNSGIFDSTTRSGASMDQAEKDRALHSFEEIMNSINAYVVPYGTDSDSNDPSGGKSIIPGIKISLAAMIEKYNYRPKNDDLNFYSTLYAMRTYILANLDRTQRFQLWESINDYIDSRNGDETSMSSWLLDVMAICSLFDNHKSNMVMIVGDAHRVFICKLIKILYTTYNTTGNLPLVVEQNSWGTGDAESGNFNWQRSNCLSIAPYIKTMAMYLDEKKSFFNVIGGAISGPGLIVLILILSAIFFFGCAASKKSETSSLSARHYGYLPCLSRIGDTLRDYMPSRATRKIPGT